LLVDDSPLKFVPPDAEESAKRKEEAQGNLAKRAS
jgi:hypothetical protein